MELSAHGALLTGIFFGVNSLHVGTNFVKDFPDRVYKSNLLPLMNQQNRLGQKTGSGFYKYDESRKATPDPQGIMPLIQQVRREAGDQTPPPMSNADIIEFLFFPIVNESCRIVAEGIVDKPSDLDVSIVFGMGFPAYRGGPIKYADLVGAGRIVKRLEEWAAKYPSQAGFFKPCEYLKSCAASGTPLSKGVSSVSAKL